MTFVGKSLAENVITLKGQCKGKFIHSNDLLIQSDLNYSSPYASVISKSSKLNRPSLLTAE